MVLLFQTIRRTSEQARAISSYRDLLALTKVQFLELAKVVHHLDSVGSILCGLPVQETRRLSIILHRCATKGFRFEGSRSTRNLCCGGLENANLVSIAKTDRDTLTHSQFVVSVGAFHLENCYFIHQFLVRRLGRVLIL